jgi:hypothetical protein
MIESRSDRWNYFVVERVGRGNIGTNFPVQFQNVRLVALAKKEWLSFTATGRWAVFAWAGDGGGKSNAAIGRL